MGGWNKRCKALPAGEGKGSRRQNWESKDYSEDTGSDYEKGVDGMTGR